MKTQILACEILAPQTQSAGRVRDVRFYSGSKIERLDFWSGDRYWISYSMKPEDARLERLNNGAPVVKDHRVSIDTQLGSTTKGWIENGEGFATILFSEREEFEGIWQDIEKGIIRNVSMGVSAENAEDVTPKGAKEKEFLLTGWEPRHIGVVPSNADPSAQFLSALGEDLPGIPVPRVTFEGLSESVAKQVQEQLKSLTERIDQLRSDADVQPRKPEPTRPAVADALARNALAQAIAKHALMAAR